MNHPGLSTFSFLFSVVVLGGQHTAEHESATLQTQGFSQDQASAEYGKNGFQSQNNPHACQSAGTLTLTKPTNDTDSDSDTDWEQIKKGFPIRS